MLRVIQYQLKYHKPQILFKIGNIFIANLTVVWSSFLGKSAAFHLQGKHEPLLLRQDAGMATVLNLLVTIAQLRNSTVKRTKKSGDCEHYSKEVTILFNMNN